MDGNGPGLTYMTSEYVHRIRHVPLLHGIFWFRCVSFVLSCSMVLCVGTVTHVVFYVQGTGCAVEACYAA